MRQYLLDWVNWLLSVGVVFMIDVRMCLGVTAVLYLGSFLFNIPTLVVLSPFIVLGVLLVAGMIINKMNGDPILEILEDEDDEQ